MLERLVLKNCADCTSQRLKRTSGARVMIFLCLTLIRNYLVNLYFSLDFMKIQISGPPANSILTFTLVSKSVFLISLKCSGALVHACTKALVHACTRALVHAWHVLELKYMHALEL